MTRYNLRATKVDGTTVMYQLGWMTGLSEAKSEADELLKSLKLFGEEFVSSQLIMM